MKKFNIMELYKELQPSGKLFPVSTNLDFWDDLYPENSAVIDREFARRFARFIYFDVFGSENITEAINNFKADVLSVLSMNQKRYAEMYRVFLVPDEDDPITYNYDMTETTGAQKQTNTYGGTSFTKGQEQFTKGSQDITKGQQVNTDGAVTNTHSVTPFDSNTPVTESTDDRTAQTITDGQRIDTDGQRIDTYGQRTDTTLQHTDTIDNDEWTLTRKGNIGTQTAADILRLHTAYWTETYKFMQLIFDDICKACLLVGD